MNFCASVPIVIPTTRSTLCIIAAAIVHFKRDNGSFCATTGSRTKKKTVGDDTEAPILRRRALHGDLQPQWEESPVSQ